LADPARSAAFQRGPSVPCCTRGKESRRCGEAAPGRRRRKHVAGHPMGRQRALAQRFGRRAGLRAGALGVAGAGAAGLVAWGRTRKEEPRGGSAPTGGQAPATAAKEPPKPGGVLTQVFYTDPSPNLDLHQTTTYTTVWPVAPCFNQLVQFQPDKPS